MLEAFIIKAAIKEFSNPRFFQRQFDPSFTEKAQKVDISVHKYDRPEALEQLQSKCDGAEALNRKVEILGVEPCLEQFEAAHGDKPIELGGPGLPDVLGVNPETRLLQVIECKGTSVDHRKISDLGLINDKRVENSAEWLDNNSDRMLSAIQSRLENDPENPQLQLVEEKLTEIINDGGFEMNPERYESSLSISCKEGAIDIYSESNQRALTEWTEATGSTQIDLHEFDPTFIDAVTALT